MIVITQFQVLFKALFVVFIWTIVEFKSFTQTHFILIFSQTLAETSSSDLDRTAHVRVVEGYSTRTK